MPEPFVSAEPPAIHDDSALYANAPIKAIPSEKPPKQLREYWQQHFPDAIRPNDIILLNTITPAPGGQPDRQALPSPNGVHP